MKKHYHYSPFTIIQGSLIVKVFLAVIVLLLFVFSLSGLLTTVSPDYRPSSKSVNNATSIFSGKMLYSLLSFENRYFAASVDDQKDKVTLEEQLLKLSANISLDDPRSLLGRELPGFAQFDSEILIAGEGTDYTNMPSESAPPSGQIAENNTDVKENLDATLGEAKPTTKNNITNGQKKVLIYSTHTRESYFPFLKVKDTSNPNLAQNSVVNVTKVGQLLQSSLENNGIGATLNSTDIMTRLIEKGWKYPRAYRESRTVVQEAMAQNKDLTYLIDVHRDAKRKKNTTTVIEGKSYAKLAFIVGGDNAQFNKNFGLAAKLHAEIQKQYPGLSRGVFKQGGPGNNGVYNQDLTGNALLIEVGGVDNNLAELQASMNAFASVFRTFYMTENGIKEASAPNNESN